MTRKNEEYLFDLVESLKVEVHENNRMLKSIISVINTYLSRHHQENEEDFRRNVLANILSETLGFGNRK